MKSYKQIKDDLDGLRLLVEKSELWVFKAKSGDEEGEDGGGGGAGDGAGSGGKGGAGGGGGSNAGVVANRKLRKEDSVEAKEEEKRPMSPAAMAEAKLFGKTRNRPPPLDRQGSAIDLDIGPPLEVQQTRNYKSIQQILTRMNRLCIQANSTSTSSSGAASGNGILGTFAGSSSGSSSAHAQKKPRKHEQRLLRNMGVHAVVLDLLQIPYDQKEDVRMNELMRLAHEFLQNFCLANVQNQALLHKHIDLFLTPGVIVVIV